MSHLLTTAEVAEWFSRPERTLVQWRYIGKGPDYVKVGGHIRYDAADVQSWLDDQRVGIRR